MKRKTGAQPLSGQAQSTLGEGGGVGEGTRLLAIRRPTLEIGAPFMSVPTRSNTNQPMALLCRNKSSWALSRPGPQVVNPPAQALSRPCAIEVFLCREIAGLFLHQSPSNMAAAVDEYGALLPRFIIRQQCANLSFVVHVYIDIVRMFFFSLTFNAIYNV